MDRDKRLTLPAFSPDKFGDIPNLFWIMNEKGEILFANMRFLKFFRRTREQVIGNTMENIIERRSSKELSKLFQVLLRKNETVREELLFTSANTTGFFSVTMIPVFDNRKLSHVFCSAFDLTPIKNRYAKIARDRTAIISILAKYSEKILPEAEKHLRIISEASTMIAVALREKENHKITKDFIKDIREASMLHDIGNLEIPQGLLSKPSRLSKDEYQIVKEHTLKGVEIIEDFLQTGSALLRVCAEIIGYHHETFDGNGYPHGISGADIPLSARIVSVADSYASMMVKRPYRDALKRDEALKIISQEKGKKFDPVIVDAFFSIEKELNTLVNLA
ncbi:hypothetical protein AT15_08085 [Kosmotoga arenicorallina S304]|uniref:HD-GYP domain-containing protein n=1 Tax=Kosmotoga arenicorallina S304 TaxID=1453497 RepID=A0A176K3B8_9BACT|nr:HD domain-containing phosphohydrolase [Kosmotoga arenicorallina]OAA31443.1 hypothetical protein AT15_08085 [Kosmotoga arenicorallina S304]